MKKIFGICLVLFLINCKKDPVCNCFNGGTCISGACQCPEGYTGEQCEMEKVPLSIKIDRVNVLSFPPTDPTGAGWDVFDGPDIRLIIRQGATVLYQSSANQWNNAAPGQAVYFTPAVTVYQVGSTPVVFELWDDDGGPAFDDYLAGATGFLYRAGQKFPDHFTTTCAGCTATFEVSLSNYVF